MPVQYLVHHMSITNPEFRIYKFFLHTFFLFTDANKIGFFIINNFIGILFSILMTIKNFYRVEKINKKMVDSEFSSEYDEQDRDFSFKNQFPSV